MKEKIELIESIYGVEESTSIEKAINNLIKRYQAQLSDDIKRLSHEDVMLITYGDQVYSKSGSKLQSLHQFLNHWGKDILSMVHILPFYPYSSDDGFSVIDYYKVNPELGTWNDVKEMSSDYYLMFDAVINHISQKSEWLQAYLEGNPAYNDYFIAVDPTLDYSLVTRPRTLPLIHEFEALNGEKRNLWTTFSKDQVDINYANPKVLLHVLDLLLYYIANGAAAVRLDAIGFMWKEYGTTCIHLPKTHFLIQLMRKVVEEVAPQTLLITETNVPHKENISYFGNGYNEAHLVYNFTLPPLLAFSILSGSSEKLVNWAQTLSLPSQDVCFFNFLASHDGVGVRPVDGILSKSEVQVLVDAVEANEGRVSYKTNVDGSQSPYELNCNYLSLLHGKDKNLQKAIKRTVLAHAIMLCMPGLPAIYFHSLFGSLNDLDGMRKTGMNRSINRQKLSMDQIDRELRDSDSLRSKVFSLFKRLITCRKQYQAFHPYGHFAFPSLSAGVFAIERSFNNDTMLCVFNLTDEDVSMNMYDGQLDVLLDLPFEGSLPPLGMAWLKVAD